MPRAPVPWVARLAAPLALGVTALLLLQWPLRQWVGAGSTLANDIAQALFAVYVAVALPWAGTRRAHLVARPDLGAGHCAAASGQRSDWRRRLEPLLVLPWAAYLVLIALPPAWTSLLQLERFPETSHPGYFVLKLALLLMALLMLGQALRQLLRGAAGPPQS